MRRVIVAIGILLALGVGLTLWVRSRYGSNESLASLQTVPVERGSVALTVSADGIVEPLTTVAVKSYAGGRVDVLAVEVGDHVKPGDLIAKIDPTDSLSSYDQARADLDAAQAKLTQAREQAQAQPTLTQTAIAQAKAAYTSAAKDLQRLQRATHPQARAQARAALDKAKANVDIAEKELARAQGLKAQGFVAQADVDTAVNRRDLAKAELASAQEQWDTLEQQLTAELESAQGRVAQAKAALDRAQADAVQDQLRRGDVVSAQAQVARARAQVTNTRTMLDYTTITAPRPGVILQKYVEQGTIVTSGRSSVTQGTDIVLIGDLTQMFVEVTVDEAEVAMLRVGQMADITLDSLPDAPFRGRVTRIDPQAVTQQNITTVLVTVEIESPDARIKPGMTATCDFVVDKVDDALYLPSRAVQTASGSHFVTIVQDGKLVEVPVEVGLVGNDRTEILEGSKQGTKVVLPVAGSPSGTNAAFAREGGMRMGGAGGFLQGGR